MGLDHSLCAIVPRPQAAAATAALLAVLAPTSRALLEAGGLLGLPAHAGRHDGGPPCLALMVHLEPEFTAQFDDEPPPCFDAPGEFGCLWATVREGTDHVFIDLAAATTGMSVVLQQSARVHALWREFAHAAGALLAYVDLEDGAALGVHPDARHVRLPAMPSGDVFDVDAWCTACVRAFAGSGDSAGIPR